tara:strand:- start:8 stop:391 length:384 start_codon:yes stop_codon:yes gene_type:complete
MKSNATITYEDDKVIKQFNRTKLGRERFDRELRAYLRADHYKLDYIPKLIGWDIVNQRVIIEKIDKVKKKKREVDIADLGKKFYEDTKLYHNDLLPKNVLVQRDTNKLYLIDFELSTPVNIHKSTET